MPTAPTIDTTPGRINWDAYPGQTRTWRLHSTGWPDGYLEATTFELRIRGGATVEGEVDDIAGTITFPDVTVPTETTSRRITIVDTVLGEVIARGTLQVSDAGQDEPSTTEVDVIIATDVTVEANLTILFGEAGEVVAGTVTSVNDIGPDIDGNVTLTAGDVGAATTAALASEATTRGNADTALDARLDAIEGLGSLATDAELAAEAATRAAADTALDGRVDALELAPPNHAARHSAAGADPVTLTIAQTTGLQAALDGKQPVDADLTALAAAGNSAVLAATTAAYTTADEAKVDFLTVTQPVDLDAIETRVNSLDAAVVIRGTWDASVGTFPGGGTAQAGDSYIVSVAGTVNGVAFAVGDRIVAIVDNASTSTFAANWFHEDYTDRVSSVDGRTGVITLTDLYQPLDGDLTAIAALTTTSYGRGFLPLADAAAALTYTGAASAAALTAHEADTDAHGLTDLIDGDRVDFAPGIGTTTINVDLSEGKTGGDILVGGLASGDDLELRSTSDSGRGNIIFRDPLIVQNEDLNSVSGTPLRLIQVESARTFVFDEGALNLGNQIQCISFRPTLEFRNASPVAGSGHLFSVTPTFKNDNGQARTTFNFISLYHSPTVQGDGALFTTQTTAVADTPTVNRINAGTTSVSVTGLHSIPTVDTGATISNRTAVKIDDTTGAGTVTEQIGIEIAALAKGGTANIGVRIAKASTAALDLSGSDGTVATGIRAVDSATTIHRSASGVWTCTGKWFVTGELEVDGALNHDGSTVGFYGVTPVARPSAYTQTFATADRTHAARTGTALTMSVGTADGTIADVTGSFSQTVLNNNFRDVGTAINNVIADLADTAQLVNAILDDLQAVGICQ